MAAFVLTSPDFADGAPIPVRFTADGPDLSPALQWTAPPEGTRSLVLLVNDPDAPVGDWVHWVLVGIPPERRDLPEGVEKTATPHGLGGAVNGANDFQRLGWGGPSPPRGKPHRYVFNLFAVDVALAASPGQSRAEVLRMLKGHILGESRLIGTYQRR